MGLVLGTWLAAVDGEESKTGAILILITAAAVAAAAAAARLCL